MKKKLEEENSFDSKIDRFIYICVGLETHKSFRARAIKIIFL
jgi:hypothetical protein